MTEKCRIAESEVRTRSRVSAFGHKQTLERTGPWHQQHNAITTGACHQRARLLSRQYPTTPVGNGAADLVRVIFLNKVPADTKIVAFNISGLLHYGCCRFG